MAGKYHVTLSTDRNSQFFNTKNSLSSIEGKVLQSIQCTIKKEDRSVSFINLTKDVLSFVCLTNAYSKHCHCFVENRKMKYLYIIKTTKQKKDNVKRV